MKFKFNPIIFKIQQTGGISTLWRSLMGFDNQNKFEQNCGYDNFLCENIEICKSARLIYAKKNELYLNSYHVIKIGPGLSLCVCHDLMEERKNDIRSLLKRFYIYLSYLSTDKIVCISDKTICEFSEVYPRLVHKCCVILNPLPSRYIQQEPNFSKKIKKDDFLFLYVGKRNGEKNFQNGLKALCDSGIKKFHVICVGDPFTQKEKNNWKILIKQNKLSCIGNVSNDDLMKLYIEADFLFLTSLDEGFGFPIIESLCLGTPIIVLYPKAASIVDPCCYEVLKQTTNKKDLQEFLTHWRDIAPKICNQIRRDFNLNVIKEKYKKQILKLGNS